MQTYLDFIFFPNLLSFNTLDSFWIFFFIYLYFFFKHRASKENLPPSLTHQFASWGNGSSGWATNFSAHWKWWHHAPSVPLCCWTRRQWGSSSCSPMCYIVQSRMCVVCVCAHCHGSNVVDVLSCCCSWSLVACWRLWSLACWSCRSTWTPTTPRGKQLSLWVTMPFALLPAPVFSFLQEVGSW